MIKNNLRKNGKKCRVWVSSHVGQKSSATCRNMALVKSQNLPVCKPLHFIAFSRRYIKQIKYLNSIFLVHFIWKNKWNIFINFFYVCESFLKGCQIWLTKILTTFYIQIVKISYLFYTWTPLSTLHFWYTFNNKPIWFCT